ncbi:MAG: DUF4197 domain-containing protein [Bacteroidales bacterium]|jgi:hypothetical protein|nr:DUF4197 domain-containing protein [Bacteroidales bacterium]
MKKRILMIAALAVLAAGCAELLKVLETVAPAALTEQEVISGLKEALITGAKNSAGRLSLTDGYYSDLAIKVLLPEEAKVIVDNISKIPGGDKLVEDVIIRINRAAEDAAKEVAPVFVSAVTQMTIADGFNILRGEDNAATQYLHSTTYNELYSLYKPKIAVSTEKKIIAGISTKESWETLTGKWNSFAGTLAGRLAGFNTVNTEIDDYLTKKALDGLFMKIAEEELKIRKDVSARVTPLLQKVFGSLDAK